MRTFDKNAYDYMQKQLNKLDPMSPEHISPIPYGVAYSRSRLFDIMSMQYGEGKIEPEELLQFIRDSAFLSEKYNGDLKKLNGGLRSMYLGKADNSKQKGLSEYQLNYLACKEIVLSAALSKAWEEYKFVFSPDRDFAEHLMQTDDFEFSPDAFMYLPVNHFFISFKNLDVQSDGVFISVEFDESNVYIYASFIDEKYAVGGIEHLVKSKTLSSFITSTLSRHETCRFSEWFESSGVVYQEVPAKRSLLKRRSEKAATDRDLKSTGEKMLVLKLLMYLASKEPDLSMDKYWKKQKSRLERLKKDVSDIPEEWDVGARYGTAIREEKRKTNNCGESKGSHCRPKAHIRSGHFHMYWTGKNRDIPRIHFLSPILVNGNKSIIPVIHRVTDAEPKGSYGEELIRDYLLNNEYEFTKEKYVKEIRKRYDFAVKTPKGTAYIEFDGEQHFKIVPNWGGKAGYEERKESDRIKNEYAKAHGVPLLRIRYDQKTEINDILDAFLGTLPVDALSPVMTDEEYYSLRH